MKRGRPMLYKFCEDLRTNITRSHTVLEISHKITSSSYYLLDTYIRFIISVSDYSRSPWIQTSTKGQRSTLRHLQSW